MASNENGDEKRDGRSSSGATRRIVVQDLPPEEVKHARGRKLESPFDDLPPGPTAAVAGNLRRRGKESAVAAAGSSINRVRFNTPGINKPVGGGPARKVLKPLLIAGMILVFGFIVTVVLILVNSGKRKPLAANRPAGQTQPGSYPKESLPTPQTPETVTDTNNLQSTSETDDARLLEAREIQSLSEKLASQVSQKTGHLFAPDFVELIRARTRDYRNKQALERARQYRREINKSFRDEGLSPLVGYAIAMSRSKFDVNANDKGLGLWQIPAAVARSQGYLGVTESTAKLTAPEASAQISAAYTKALLSTFDAEDFIYAIACFGMDLQEVGRLQARLISAVPEAGNRLAVMNAIKAGVLSAEQVDNIARFFAAGIVGENPRAFGLEDSQRFSSLY